MVSRRTFLGQVSATSLLALGTKSSNPQENAALQPILMNFSTEAITTSWKTFGRALLSSTPSTISIQNGFLVSPNNFTDGTLSFEARALPNAEQVQIWAGFRCVDRRSRYVFALRGGDNDDVYLARYAPDGQCRFLGVSRLGFHPEPGVWYSLRAVVNGDRLRIYLGQETVPRLDVRDETASWSHGGVVLGGGWLPVEYRNVSVNTLIAPEELSQPREPLEPADQILKEQRRAVQRNAFRSRPITNMARPREEISLNGDWLFVPEQDLKATDRLEGVEAEDGHWHVLEVPNLWKPLLSWLHGETGFAELDGVSSTKGISDKLYAQELKRLEAYTFDWQRTRSGWYRQYIDLSTEPNGRRFELCFDAIAKLASVWVNGEQVGTHVGMFGEIKCDISKALHRGSNAITVQVLDSLKPVALSNEVRGVAVTVEVTEGMLNTLPHGMYREDSVGIWQPVTLTITGKTFIENVYTKPRLDGLDFDVTLRNDRESAFGTSLSYKIYPDGENSTVDQSKTPNVLSIARGSSVTIACSTPAIAPKLWSPDEPNLYILEIELISEGDVIDRLETRFGFRTFEVHDDKLLLNGTPLLLRGGNHFPHALRPNDLELARRFITLAKEGNVMATRSHTAPFTKTWLDAADELGMLVSFEGTWPWLMLEGSPPGAELLQHWKAEFLSLIRKHRNHPSIVLWTVNNEMKFEFFDQKSPIKLKEKWAILSDAVKSVRSIDPTRPVICDSSYYRQEVKEEYISAIQPEGFDDGDIDDVHRYYGWYEPSFFHFFHGEFGRETSWKNRPLISQEMSTGYPRNDDGHPTRFYLYKHYTPQSLVGDEAWENRDPAIFLHRQAFITKELSEAIRRSNRQECSGILHFAYLSWFKNVWDPDSIEPFETYHELRKALQPILVSAELYGRHFYAGAQRTLRICIANDSNSRRTIPASRLLWRIECSSTSIISGEVSVLPVPYYENMWMTLNLGIPKHLPAPSMDARLVLQLVSEGKTVSENSYEIKIATPVWAGVVGREWPITHLYDPHQQAPAAVHEIGPKLIKSLSEVKLTVPLVIAGADKMSWFPRETALLRQFVARGGRLLLLSPGLRFAELMPEFRVTYRPCPGEIVSMLIPESPIFDEIEPLDLAWFELGKGILPRACRGVYRTVSQQSRFIELAQVIDQHAYLKTPEDLSTISGSPLVEVQIGRGKIISSEMCLEAADADPIAGKLLGNLIQWLHSKD